MHVGAVWAGSELTGVDGKLEKKRFGLSARLGVLSSTGANKDRFFVGVPVPPEYRGQTVCVKVRGLISLGTAHLSLLHQECGDNLAISDTVATSAEQSLSVAASVSIPAGGCARGDDRLWIGVTALPATQLDVQSLEVKLQGFDETDCPTPAAVKPGAVAAPADAAPEA